MYRGVTRASLVDSTLISAGDESRLDVPQRLLIGTGQQVVTHMLPSEGTVTVGRAPEAVIRVEDPSVSRVHVRLHIGAVIRVEDLGSANGTRTGGTRLPPNQSTPLPPGQVIEIGGSWMMIANSPLRGSTTRSIPEPAELTPAALLPDPVREKDGLVVQDDRMLNLHDLIERAALSDITVLLLGETGVGKEVFARRIHTLSPRAGKSFLGLNCAALAGSLLESELFGHERGAFTGAGQAKPGLLETAEGGTVLLDEVGDMPLSIQVKLLRVLEERQVLRIGGTRPRPIDVRVLSATNKDLAAEVEAGSFRRDLFFRLNSITIEIPPLRQRASEIEPLARRFAEQAAARLSKPVPQIDADVWERLVQCRWPGNVRQLRNVMERAVVLARGGRITSDTIAADIQAGPPFAAAPVAADERREIAAVLERCAGNQTRAAALLGISRRTLINRLAEYDLPRPRRGGKRQGP
jgi:two-component system response regulator AtoC